MAKMTKEMQEMFNRVGIKQLATADRNGVPNVVPINFMKILDEETILASAVFMTKTFNNLKENPVCALSIWEGFAGVQIKGSASIVTEGPVFKDTQTWTEEEGKKLGLALQSKGAIVIKISAIFSIAPGEDAGKQIA
ncbi:MAG: pyridoxamine 5'-phosphate oxidase family protein [Acidobacteriota bacterium]|jgi:predicted pyridoxine 5'-phosphate oxidase superfamily flavin-nucleotide-binding protein|nr:pyridoxamine 5'-phosphate oxidase family protein [Acidobacteriota bacterium]